MPSAGLDMLNGKKILCCVLLYTVQAAVQANTFVVGGNGVTKPLEQLLPNILTQLGQDNIQSLLKRVEGMGLLKKGDAPAAAGADDEVPALVENFEDAADK
jgi:nascent polypeptide-associated complex subunit beta